MVCCSDVWFDYAGVYTRQRQNRLVAISGHVKLPSDPVLWPDRYTEPPAPELLTGAELDALGGGMRCAYTEAHRGGNSGAPTLLLFLAKGCPGGIRQRGCSFQCVLNWAVKSNYSFG